MNKLLLRRVRRGHKLLLKMLGEGYWKKINMSTLDMGNASSCILGQLFGFYSDGLVAVGLPNMGSRFAQRAASYGFYYDMPKGIDYQNLAEVWTEIWK